ncbi:MAG TPA: hypothetical protein ENN07_02510 [candidate division Zixibacteria bacterium]|nr:hypothetical protein [candidate division Zixibacteria bacterium]
MSCKILATAVISLGLLASMGCGRDPAPSHFEILSWEEELFDAINGDRILSGIAPLERIDVLDRSAAEIAFFGIREDMDIMDLRRILAEHGVTAYVIAAHVISSFRGRPNNMVFKAREELRVADEDFIENADFRSGGLAIRYFDGYYFVVFVGAHILDTDADGNPIPTITANIWQRERVRPLELEHLRLLNETRTAKGLPPVQPDDQLSALARVYAEKMLREGFFGHSDPSGKGFIQRIDEAPLVKYRGFGENLASLLRPNDPPVDAMTSLLSSPGHRENILRKEFTHVGVAAATDGRWWMFVQIFGIER